MFMAGGYTSAQVLVVAFTGVFMFLNSSVRNLSIWFCSSNS